MKRSVYLSVLGLVLAMMGCSEEVSRNNTDTFVNLCGNGVLDAGEVCDGRVFADGAKVCPDNLVIKDVSAFACTNMCQLDISDACGTSECGDGELAANEVCDGSLFRGGAKVCPNNMVQLPNPVFGCTDACQIDISQACRDSICGDSRLTGSEPCDGDLLDESAKVCPEGQKIVERRNLFTCTSDCALDDTWACIPNTAMQPSLYFSELGILRRSASSTSTAHLYVEIGNLGAKTTLSDCKLVGVNLTADYKIDPGLLIG